MDENHGDLAEDFEGTLDLDADPAGKRRGADGKAGMTTGITKHLDHEVRRAIHDLRMICKVRPARHEATEFDHADDTVKVPATSLPQLGDEVEPTNARMLGRILHGHARTNSALSDDLQGVK